jgi:hypothetical protein
LRNYIKRIKDVVEMAKVPKSEYEKIKRECQFYKEVLKAFDVEMTPNYRDCIGKHGETLWRMLDYTTIKVRIDAHQLMYVAECKYNGKHKLIVEEVNGMSLLK